ncbi:putative microtubule motor [Kockovaella imperatae]|uniref:Putative microtubule motor n=1 Tax=Kockovaella imperatae TaxID=4999 RepID=A0A1Y1UJL4_9TREE|nr:putative microtubule motor [Kockovaella imperatae]ORX38250.1 putative microtubule motor [Kockovaella imperatae]
MSRKPTATGRPTIARVTSMSSMAPPKSSSTAVGRLSVMPAGSVKPPSMGKDDMSGPSRHPITVGETNINVVVRLRGRTPREVESTSPIIAKTQGALSKGITIEAVPQSSAFGSAGINTQSPDIKSYAFDRVLGPEADQTMVFEEVAKSMLDEVLGGYNCTIFAYGQTGTGKTYTMQGDLDLSALDTPNDAGGIIPRVLHRLFALLEAKSNTDYVVKCSYLEIYNEDLRDLLSQDYGVPGSNSQLKIYEDGKKGTMVQGAEEVGLQNLSHALKVLKKGCQRRQTAETKMNTESSRSHTIFTVTVMVKETGSGAHSEDTLRIGKFNLVDLAGSEAIGRSGATEKRAREAGMINQSLLTLGRVISALVEKGPHIPYRESKLTRLLQDSLGGRTKTCIVATVSPVRSNLEETLSTLDYALRARSIKNKPEINSHLTKAGLLREYLGDIERLKAELIAARDKSGIYVPDEQWSEMTEAQTKLASDLVDAQQRADGCRIELNTKKREFDDLVVRMVATKEDLKKTRQAEKELGELLEQTQQGLSLAKQKLEEEMVVSHAYQRGESRMEKVAEELKDVALASVGDVGALFDKLARKTSVMGSNTDAASAFGSDLSRHSTALRQAFKGLQNVQANQRAQVEEDLAVHVKQGQDMAKKDVQDLESAFATFNDLAQSLEESIESGKSVASEAAQSVVQVKGEVQHAVQQWAAKLNKRSSKMIAELLDNQKDQLAMVGSVLTSTADLVDAVISTAHAHLKAEREASEEARRLALDASDAEVLRLRSQNALLSRMLIDERSKTVKLRTDLVMNFTNMVESFTDAQDSSLSQAVGAIQSENEQSLAAMDIFAGQVSDSHNASTGLTDTFEVDLQKAQRTAEMQRVTGQESLDGFTAALHTELNNYGKKASTEAAKCVSVVEASCGQLDSTALQLSQAATEVSGEQSKTLHAIAAEVERTHSQSSERIEVAAAQTDELSATLMKSHASAASAFENTLSTAQSTLEALVDRTAIFVSQEILEDVPTGVTPKKKSWNVPTAWEKTEPRDILIAQMRKRQASGSQPIVAVVPSGQDAPSLGSHQNLEESTDVTEHSAPQSQSETPLETAPLRIVKPRPKVLPGLNGVSNGIPTSKTTGKLHEDFSGSRTALSVLGGENTAPRKVRR